MHELDLTLNKDRLTLSADFPTMVQIERRLGHGTLALIGRFQALEVGFSDAAELIAIAASGPHQRYSAEAIGAKLMHEHLTRVFGELVTWLTQVVMPEASGAGPDDWPAASSDESPDGGRNPHS